MNKIISVKEATKLDQYYCKNKNIKTIDLVKRAGKALFKHFIKNIIPSKRDKILVLCGPGNNGCDALVIGSELLKAGYCVKIYAFGKLNCKDIILENKIDVIYDLPIIEISDCQYIIDGIFGTGLNRMLDKKYLKIIELINNSKAYIFSIDIPSGLNGNNGLVIGSAVRANYTAIINNYKLGNLLNDAPDYHGEIRVVDIGLIDDHFKIDKYLLKKESLIRLPKRPLNSHKYKYGNILVLGGSLGMTGAPQLSSYAALKMGSGLASLALNSNLMTSFHCYYPEIIINYYDNIETLKPIFNKKDVVIFGPGLGRDNEENYLILEEILKLNIPLVIDADGLFYLKKFINNGYNLNNVIITPHIGELGKLLDIEIEDVKANGYDYVKHLAKKYKLTIVLKGNCSIICNREKVYFSNYGNPGMATAGSGDVLAGIIGALLGFGYNNFDAANLGVYIHSIAGKHAKDEKGEYGMIASDIINQLFKAIAEVENI